MATTKKLQRDDAMEIIIGVVLIAIALIILTKLNQPTKGSASYFKKRPLSQVEQVLYYRLKEALPEYEILAQVAFSQMIGIKGGNNKERWSKWGKAKQKVADFLVCDRSFNILLAIELDDRTHNSKNDQARDCVFRRSRTPIPAEVEHLSHLKHCPVTF